MSDRVARDALHELLASGAANQAAPAGWKVALNVPAVQNKFGLSHALTAPLGTLRSIASGTELPADSTRWLHVEAEIALRLARDLDAPTTVDDLRTSIESFCPCLELVDYALPRVDLPTMLGHRFFHYGIVTGATVTAEAFSPLPSPYPSAVGADGLVHTRVPGVVPDDVVVALQGVLERVLEVGGTLRKGQLVLCGSYIDPLPLTAGTRVEVDYGPYGVLAISRAPAS